LVAAAVVVPRLRFGELELPLEQLSLCRPLLLHGLPDSSKLCADGTVLRSPVDSNREPTVCKGLYELRLVDSNCVPMATKLNILNRLSCALGLQ
jgi:hypothetical protein